ncbi:MAG: response regulator [Flavobacteriales bacterium]|nr:response regulator [Flavobacteriales bacterium]
MKSYKTTKIVIVDDDPFFTELVKENLEEKNYCDLEIYHSGQECVDNIDSDTDIVLLDHEMEGGLNGIETLKGIRNLKINTDVIFLTGQDDPQVARNALKHGAYDYVIKNESAMHRLIFTITNLRIDRASRNDSKVWEKSKGWAFAMLVAITVFVTVMAHDFILEMVNR